MKLVLISDAINGVQTVVDVLTPAEGLTVEQTFPLSVIEAAKQAPDEVARGWTTEDAGETYQDPVSEPTPTAPVTARTFIEFMDLFKNDEQAAIVNSTDPQIRLFCLMAAGATMVDLADPRTVAGTQQLETLGLIGKGRAKQVLAGAAPTT